MTQLVSWIAIVAATAWAFWPTLAYMQRSWEEQPDYSHGYLVPLVALFVLVVPLIPLSRIPILQRLMAMLGMEEYLEGRRESFPGLRPNLLLGVAVLLVSLGVRASGALAFVDAIDGWALVIWCLGITLCIGGLPLLRWSWPALLFLLFMVPLPFRGERLLSLPLQNIATKVSCWSLQLLGQPAFAEGHVIWLNQRPLEVAQACSGLRIFVAIIAVAYVYAMVIRTAWWEKVLLFASVLPIAIVANGTRIVVTGLLYQFTSGEVAHEFSHNMAGFAMIPFAGLLFAGVVWYVRLLFPEYEVYDTRAITRGARPT